MEWATQYSELIDDPDKSCSTSYSSRRVHGGSVSLLVFDRRVINRREERYEIAGCRKSSDANWRVSNRLKIRYVRSDAGVSKRGYANIHDLSPFPSYNSLPWIIVALILRPCPINRRYEIIEITSGIIFPFHPNIIRRRNKVFVQFVGTGYLTIDKITILPLVYAFSAANL